MRLLNFFKGLFPLFGKAVPSFLAGIMSDKPAESIADSIAKLNQTAYSLGCTIKELFMTVLFLALPVIPELRITDKGLEDVTKFWIVPLHN